MENFFYSVKPQPNTPLRYGIKTVKDLWTDNIGIIRTDENNLKIYIIELPFYKVDFNKKILINSSLITKPYPDNPYAFRMDTRTPITLIKEKKFWPTPIRTVFLAEHPFNEKSTWHLPTVVAYEENTINRRHPLSSEFVTWLMGYPKDDFKSLRIEKIQRQSPISIGKKTNKKHLNMTYDSENSLQDIINKAQEIGVEDQVPSIKESLIDEEHIVQFVKNLCSIFSLTPEGCLIAIYCLFLKGAANNGTPASLTVEVVNFLNMTA
jgi:hypothetical protein